MLITSFGFAQTIPTGIITGTATNIIGVLNTSYPVSLQAQVVGCGAQVPLVVNGSVITNTQTISVTSPAFVASMTVWGNNIISCGGQNYTLYALTWLVNGFPAAPTATYRITQGQTCNISDGSCLPIGFVPAVISKSAGAYCPSITPQFNGFNPDYTPNCSIGTPGPAGPIGPSGAFSQAGFLSAAAYNGTFAAMVTDSSTHNSTITVSTIMPVTTNVTVSADRSIAVLSGGQFNCSSGITITFLGDFNAQMNSQAFGSNCTITGLKWARPEWWGSVTGTNGLISNAVNALASNGGDIYLQNANYRGGFDLLNPATGSANYLTKPNVHLHGTVRPSYATDFSALLSGTVIQDGMYVNANGFTAEHLGWDAGSVVMAAYYPTFSALDSIEITSAVANPTHLPNLTGIQLNDVNCLGKNNSSADHCMLVENVDGAYIHNVQTVYHEHGLVLKGINSIVDQVLARGSISDGVIVKSDNYAPSSNDFLSNITISNLLTVGDTAGLELDAEESPEIAIFISNVDISNTSYGIELLSNSTITSVFINGYGFSGNGESVACLETLGTQNSANIQIINFSCNNSLGFLFETASNIVQIDNGLFSGINGDAISVTSPTASQLTVSNSNFNVVSGYAINVASPNSATVSQLTGLSSGVSGNLINGFVLFSDASIATPFTFLNSWHNNGGSGNSIGSYKSDRGRVYLGGTLVPGTSTIITTLPSNLKPLTVQRLIADGFNGTTFLPCEILIATNGDVSVTNYTTCATSYVSLDGLSFWNSTY